MNKQILLPKLSVIGIKKNKDTYFPYIMAGVLSVFVFFVFSSILHNDIMETLPRSGYVGMLMSIGLALLGIILIPFFSYVNSFLIKRRKKELGLYSILGLEKKHIAIMMFWETLILFGVVFIGGIILGIVFSKLAFLILLNLTGMPIETKFAFSLPAFKKSFFYFLFVYGINLVRNLIEVYKSNPNDLMQGARKGDKEPKRLWVSAFLGVFFLAAGYIIAMLAEINSMIFLDFFLAVAFVIFGTHHFFKAGILALLKILRRNKKFYYKKENYVTISGMLYRMKKSASSLANICIFSTMVIITLLCTLSLWKGMEGILKNQHPYDMTLNFNTIYFNQADALEEKMNEIAKNQNINIENKVTFTYQKIRVRMEGNILVNQKESDNWQQRKEIKLISLADYNQMENTNKELEENEIMVFATGSDLGLDSIILNNQKFQVKEELKHIVFTYKEVKDKYLENYYFIVKDKKVLDQLQKAYNSTEENDRIYTVRFQIRGEEKDKEAFISNLSKWAEGQKGFNNIVNGIANRENMEVTYGGLLFLGIFFGFVFCMCLILIMYYKQITEGFDDRENFQIMQKVGMSDKEVRSTIRRQILIVFFLPLIIAVCHTLAGFGMTSKLLGTVFLFDEKLIFICGCIVVAFFIGVYGLSYLMTSKSYYKIVKQMN